MSNTEISEQEKWLEVAGLTDFITQYTQSTGFQALTIDELNRILNNPYANIKKIQQFSRYITNKNGVVKETLRALKTLPPLNHSTSWSEVDDVKKLKAYEKKVNDFLKNIKLKQMVRDGIYQLAQDGTLVMVLRNKKYVQFLEIDNLSINKMRNGKWVVEFDLATISSMSNFQDRMNIIESLPDEVSIAAYNQYIKKGEDYRYVEIKGAEVLSIDGVRNMPYGLPYTIGAWTSLMQKDLMDNAERSIMDRLMKQVMILYASHLEEDKPVPKEILTAYFKDVSSLFNKSQTGNSSRVSGSTSGTGTIALPHFLSLKSLDINSDGIPKEVYEKVEKDIYSNLGISPAILWGGGGANYASASLNTQKFMRFIVSILELFEPVINSYITQILPKSVECEFIFVKADILDHELQTKLNKELYLQTGISKPYLESVTGLPYDNMLYQANYEKNILEVENILYPPKNAYTSNSGEVGAPKNENPTNENTVKSKTNGGNESPRPSTD